MPKTLDPQWKSARERAYKQLASQEANSSSCKREPADAAGSLFFCARIRAAEQASGGCPGGPLQGWTEKNLNLSGILPDACLETNETPPPVKGNPLGRRVPFFSARRSRDRGALPHPSRHSASTWQCRLTPSKTLILLARVPRLRGTGPRLALAACTGWPSPSVNEAGVPNL